MPLGSLAERHMTESSYPAVAYSSGQGDPVPRRAYDRKSRGVCPIDLANAAQNGV